MAAANLVAIADPEVLVLGGIMASAADLLLEPVRTEIGRRLPDPMTTGADDRARDARRGRSRHRRRAPGRRRRGMIVLSGAELVLPDRILCRPARSSSTAAASSTSVGPVPVRLAGPLSFTATTSSRASSTCTSTASRASIRSKPATRFAAIAARLPRYGVTAFCPTTVACSPDALRARAGTGEARAQAPAPGAARVLPAHLESNFINPGIPRRAAAEVPSSPRARPGREGQQRSSGTEVARRATIRAGRHFERDRAGGTDVGIVTLAPELDGGLDLIAWLLARGHRVARSLGCHVRRGAQAAIAAGARHATHLFNRMPPLGHRSPGLAGAILQTEEVAAELICDGFHVHPALVRTAIAAKRPSRVLAITDGTAASGLAARAARRGSATNRLPSGKLPAFLRDGTLAGSVLTMDGAFRMLVERAGACSLMQPPCARPRRRANWDSSAMVCWQWTESPMWWFSLSGCTACLSPVRWPICWCSTPGSRSCRLPD